MSVLHTYYLFMYGLHNRRVKVTQVLFHSLENLEKEIILYLMYV